MDEFDKLLRMRAQQEPTPLPEPFVRRVRQTCAALPQKERRAERKRVCWPLQAAAVLVLLLVAVSNLSPAAAQAMQRVPVLGQVVEVITLRNYLYEDDHNRADVQVPQIEAAGAAGAQVNEQVQADTDRLVAQFEADMVQAGYQGLEVSYQVVTDTDDWFTLRIDALQTMASGYQTARFYHIDRHRDQLVTLSDLFPAGTDYAAALSEEVLRQMQQQMAADETAAYFPEAFTGIDPEQNFYWNEAGELVLVFDEYTIAAGAMGMPEFVIPNEVRAALTLG